MKILLMGPLAPPYSGQSIAFTVVVNHLRKKGEDVLILNISGTKRICSMLAVYLKIIYYLIFYKIEKIYFTCSRTLPGSTRDLLLLLLARLRNIKVVNHLHGADFLSFYYGLPIFYKKLLCFAYQHINTTIILLEGMKTQFVDFPNMKLPVVPNAYSADLDDCLLEKQIKTENEEIHILYLSNLMKSKGIIHFLNAAKSILKENNNVVFSIAGLPVSDDLASDKEISKDFNLLYSELKMEYPDRITYHGSVFGENKTNLLCNSDIFILPTFYKTEAFPISILEAMRTGNYIISTRHNYISDIISEKNGDLIEPNSETSIVCAINNILNNKERLNAIQNYNINQAREKYNEQQYAYKIINVIKTV